MLGRAFHGDGTVLLGKRLGRRLGFPTLNVILENEIVPAEGVYITAVYIPSFQRVFTSVTNIGVRPTVYENSGVTIETHLLDFTADVYRERVRLFFLKRLRYAPQLTAFVEANHSRLDHLLYDIGFDYRIVGGQIQILKSAYYGAF